MYRKILEKHSVSDAPALSKALYEILSSPVNVKIVVEDGGRIPEKATDGSGGYDLFVAEDVDVVDGRFLAPLKIRFALPKGYVAVIKPRSGYTLKGMEVLNQYNQKIRVNAWVNDGVIDSDYIGLVGVLMQSEVSSCKIAKGTRVAQMLILRAHEVEWEEVDALEATERGSGGYGHTNE